MATIGIIVAMEKELRQLLSLLSGLKEEERNGQLFRVGTLGEKRLVVQQCGIGKVNAAIGTMELIRSYRPDGIVSSGVAGGATLQVPRLGVVASLEVAYHDAYCGSGNAPGQIQGMPPRFKSDPRMVSCVRGMENVRTGLIASGDWFVDSKEKAREISSRFPDALAIDMESGAIAQVCHVHCVPFISFRIISDIPADDERGSQYYDFWERMAENSFAVLREFLERLTL